MQPTSRIMPTRRVARYLVYSSVVIGLALLIQLYSLVPTWLFYLVLAGWVVYLFVAIEAARGREIAYPSAVIMSILTFGCVSPTARTLLVSRPWIYIGCFDIHHRVGYSGRNNNFGCILSSFEMKRTLNTDEGIQLTIHVCQRLL